MLSELQVEMKNLQHLKDEIRQVDCIAKHFGTKNYAKEFRV